MGAEARELKRIKINSSRIPPQVGASNEFAPQLEPSSEIKRKHQFFARNARHFAREMSSFLNWAINIALKKKSFLCVSC